MRSRPSNPRSAGERVLTRDELNRATLARQMLLAREKLTPAAAVARLAGMQAQEARAPYVGLWSRIQSFRAADLTAAFLDRTIVRTVAMRATIHLMESRDFLSLRAAIQPVLDGGAKWALSKTAGAAGVPAIVAHAREFLLASPAPFDDLRRHLATLHPGEDPRMLAYAVRMHLPLVQVPTVDAAWGYPGAADFAPAENWLGGPIDPEPKTAELVLRYLAAFGPATVADVAAWSGLRNMGPVLEELRPRLETFRNDAGRELFDLPDAPRPRGETPVPVRFIPDYDNLLLAHADRSRIVDDEHRAGLVTKNLRVLATFLVDGRVAGTWRIDRKGKTATLGIQPFGKIPRRVRVELETEGEALLAVTDAAAKTRAIEFS